LIKKIKPFIFSVGEIYHRYFIVFFISWFKPCKTPSKIDGLYFSIQEKFQLAKSLLPNLESNTKEQYIKKLRAAQEPFQRVKNGRKFEGTKGGDLGSSIIY